MLLKKSIISVYGGPSFYHIHWLDSFITVAIPFTAGAFTSSTVELVLCKYILEQKIVNMVDKK